MKMSTYVPPQLNRSTYNLIVLLKVISATFPAYTANVPYPEASTVQTSSEYYQLSAHLPAGQAPTTLLSKETSV